MIHLLPYMEYKIECERSAEEVCAILKKVTDTRKGAFRNYINTEFNGTVSPSGFRIACDFRSNRFSYPIGSPAASLTAQQTPIIKGTINSEGGRSVVHLKLQFDMGKRIFWTIWLGGMTFFFLTGLLALLFGSLGGLVITLIAAAFLVPTQIIIRHGFRESAEDIIDRLEELLF